MGLAIPHKFCWPKLRCWQVFPSGSRGNPCPCLSELLKAADVPWLLVPSLHRPLPPSSKPAMLHLPGKDTWSRIPCIQKRWRWASSLPSYQSTGSPSPSWWTFSKRGWHVCLETTALSPTAPRPGRLTWFTDSEGTEVSLSGTKAAAAYMLCPEEYFFSTELPLNNRHLFVGYRSGAFYGNACCCLHGSASTPHPILSHYEIALLFLKGTIKCN